MNIKRTLTPLLITLLLFSIVVMGAPDYGNVGPTTEFGFDIKIEDEIVAEGSSADDHETTILFTDPTADRTITIPNSDQTVGTATSIEDNLILEVDLKAVDESADEDILTKEDTTGDFEWHSAAEIKSLMSLDLVANLKVKLDATEAPTVNNDVDEGYTVGSRWFDVTNDKEYACLDNTDGAAVWTETTGAGGGATTFVELTDTPANYTGSSLKHVRVNVGETALEFVTLGGGGDMLKATYDTDDDGDIDVAAGGTEKSSWTLYAIPYLSGTTAFGEILIGTAEYALTVNAGANGYDWTEFQTPLTFGIADDNAVEIDDVDAADNDYARFTVAGLEGRSHAEMMMDTNPITTVTEAHVMTVAEAGTVLVSCAATPYTITLPTAVGNVGLTYHFIKTDANYFLITLDGDGTETINYENSTGAPVLTYARLNTYCAEATLTSDDSNWQVINEAMGQVPACHAYAEEDQTDIPDDMYVYIDLGAESFDIGSNFSHSPWATGTADENTLNHLVDDGESQFTSAMVGYRVQNLDSSDFAWIIGFVDAGDLTLDADIFPDGNETYAIKHSKYVIPIPGKYQVIGHVNFDTNVVANKLFRCGVQVNTTTYLGTAHSSNTGKLGFSEIVPLSFSADDVIVLKARHDTGAGNVSINGVVGDTYLNIRLISKD